AGRGPHADRACLPDVRRRTGDGEGVGGEAGAVFGNQSGALGAAHDNRTTWGGRGGSLPAGASNSDIARRIWVPRTVPGTVSGTQVPAAWLDTCDTTVCALERARHPATMPAPNDSDPESIASLLQALDEVREAAKRVDRERNGAAEHPDTARAESAPPAAAPAG